MTERTKPPSYPCTHPELRPTRWGQEKPAPAHFTGCSHSYSCPTCGWGQGCFPDPCYEPLLDRKLQQIFDEVWNTPGTQEAMKYLADN